MTPTVAQKIRRLQKKIAERCESFAAQPSS